MMSLAIAMLFAFTLFPGANAACITGYQSCTDREAVALLQVHSASISGVERAGALQSAQESLSGECLKVVSQLCSEGFKPSALASATQDELQSELDKVVNTLASSTKAEDTRVLEYKLIPKENGYETIEIFQGPVKERETSRGPMLYTAVHERPEVTRHWNDWLKFRNPNCERTGSVAMTRIECPGTKVWLRHVGRCPYYGSLGRHSQENGLLCEDAVNICGFCAECKHRFRQAGARRSSSL